MSTYKHENLLKRGNELFEVVDKLDTHSLQPYSIKDYSQYESLIAELKSLYKSIPNIKKSTSLNDVYLSELKRVTKQEIILLEDSLYDEIDTPEKILSLYNVTKEDIKEIEDWLLSNKEAVVNANRIKYERYSKFKKFSVNLGITHLRQVSESLLEHHLDLIRTILTTNDFGLLHFADVFSEYIIKPDSSNKRSYCNKITKVCGMGTESLMYIYNGKVSIDMEEFISGVGHEIIGHLLNYAYTEKSDLPFFIKHGSPQITVASRESITDYFESRIFEYLMSSSSAVKLLSEQEPFEEVYESYKNTKLLSKYNAYYGLMGYWILSQTKQSDYKLQHDWLSKYTLESKAASYFINYYRTDWHHDTGLILPHIVEELKYAVNTVSKILHKYSNVPKSQLESLILTGMWTNDGLIDYVDFSLNH